MMYLAQPPDLSGRASGILRRRATRKYSHIYQRLAEHMQRIPHASYPPTHAHRQHRAYLLSVWHSFRTADLGNGGTQITTLWFVGLAVVSNAIFAAKAVAFRHCPERHSGLTQIMGVNHSS